MSRFGRLVASDAMLITRPGKGLHLARERAPVHHALLRGTDQKRELTDLQKIKLEFYNSS